MQTHKEYIEALWNKWLANEISADELDQLLNALEQERDNPEELSFIQEGFSREEFAFRGQTIMDADQRQHLWNRWQASLEAGAAVSAPAGALAPVRQIPAWRRWVAAAAILLLLGGGAWWWKTQREGAAHEGNLAADVQPGRDGAILTLADGKQLVLDSAGNGLIAAQQGAQVVLAAGRLNYQATGSNNGERVYNSMRTPRGRQFQLKLPDGTQVWLNSASSIRFPTVFSDTARNVEVSGEAYFEVAQNVQAPFRVLVAGRAAVQVLGTHFNIEAYEDGRTLRTTLLQGSVRVQDLSHQQQQSVVLQKGQQAVIGSGDAMSVNRNVDLGTVMAWKNGLFNFEGLSLQEAMQQLERWYDIEVVYENGVPEIPFEGEMSRHISLDGLLKMLAAADLKFRFEKDRKLIITK